MGIFSEALEDKIFDMEKENEDLKKQLAIAERALLILGAELEKWKCPHEHEIDKPEADDSGVEFDFEYCEKNCHNQTSECWVRVAKAQAAAKIEKEKKI